MERQVGQWRDMGDGGEKVGLEKDRWGWGETGGVGLPSRVPAVVRMLVLPLALNEASV